MILIKPISLGVLQPSEKHNFRKEPQDSQADYLYSFEKTAVWLVIILFPMIPLHSSSA